MPTPGPRRNDAGARRSPVQDRSRTTVAIILEAAAQVFAAHGYAATTNQIAARAGVSIGTLYQYFADKDALLLQLAERHVEEARQHLSGVLGAALAATGPEGDRATLVRTTVETVVALNRPDDLHTLLYTTAPRTPALVATLESLRDDLTAAVAILLQGDGVPPEDARRRGHALVVAIDACIHEHVLASDSQEDHDQRVDDVTTLALAALAAYATPS
jgi:AcrR family transcriptional regulator